jgi:hypothetical protein
MAMMMWLITSHLSWRLSERLASGDITADQLKLDQEQRPWWWPWWWRLIGR